MASLGQTLTWTSFIQNCFPILWNVQLEKHTYVTFLIKLWELNPHLTEPCLGKHCAVHHYKILHRWLRIFCPIILPLLICSENDPSNFAEGSSFNSFSCEVVVELTECKKIPARVWIVYVIETLGKVYGWLSFYDYWIFFTQSTWWELIALWREHEWDLFSNKQFNISNSKAFLLFLKIYKSVFTITIL